MSKEEIGKYKMYISHINKTKNEIQSVKEHSENTAQLCQDFTVSKLRNISYAIGILHDIGKYQNSFQRRINGESIRVEHSICGAKVAREKFGSPISTLIQYCVAGHHSGLPDGGAKNDTPDKSTLFGRLKRNSDNYNAYEKELFFPELDEQSFAKYLIEDCGNNEKLLTDKFAFIIRYCFSCLVDADSIDTMKFCGSGEINPLNSDFKDCLDKLDIVLSSFNCITPLQKARSSLQRQVFEKLDIDSEIYLMNMPTGSGKTLCSMKFALERVIRKSKKRIIYIIPYNSIIDQTCEVLESIFGADVHILRHQSTFSYEDNEDYDEDYLNSVRYSSENWDASIIITTSVQFFESIYSNKRGKLRKLHNVSDSVLIFDEAHLMPCNYLKPCLEAISFITKYLNSEALFLTATMPDFAGLIKEYALPTSVITELIADKSDFSHFNKCIFKNIGQTNEENLIKTAGKFPASLIIVNKRSTAKTLYKICSGEKYHLSTYMTGYDRKRVIAEVKERLKRLKAEFQDFANVPEESRITLVSTSLIEAGVDLDFFVVFRELTGLDSILQSGGRCNREGERKVGTTFVFSLEETQQKLNSDEKVNLTKGILDRFEDISSPQSIDYYYNALFFMRKDELGKNSICEFCDRFDLLPFKRYSEHFELIPSNTVSIIAGVDKKSREIISAIRNGETVNQRQLQVYTFSVYKYEFDMLLQQHVIDDSSSGIWYLVGDTYYDNETGVRFEGNDYIV